MSPIMTAPNTPQTPAPRDPLLDALTRQLLAARDLIDGALQDAAVLRERVATVAAMREAQAEAQQRRATEPPPTLGSRRRAREAAQTTPTTEDAAHGDRQEA